MFFAILTSGYRFAARKGPLLDHLTTISSPVSSSTSIPLDANISSNSSSFSDLIFPIHFTAGYSDEAKNGQNLPVLTTIVPSIPSGHGFHSYLDLSALSIFFSSSG
jgi:hypothetical protein